MIKLNFKPYPTLTTQRLVLRELSQADQEEIFALRSNPYINKYINRPPVTDPQEAISFINKINQGKEWFYWAITLKENPKLIGTICIWNIDKAAQSGEVGYELLPDYQKKGLMFEALSEVIAFAFKQMNLQALEAFTHKGNDASARLLVKANFNKIGPSSENPREIVYSLSKDSFE